MVNADADAQAEAERLVAARKYDQVLVSDVRLRENSARPSLASYIAQVWRYRHFIFAHARSRSFADTDDLFLGKLWNVLEPAIRIAMYGVLFGLVLNTARGIENFIGYLVIGITFFSILSKGMGGGAGVLQRNRSMIGSFRFPRASIVFSESIKGFISQLFQMALAIIAALLFQWGSFPTWRILLTIPLVILMQCFSTGLMLLTARISAFLPDAKKMIQFVNRAWFYVSGIFFSIERYASVPELQEIMLKNPAYIFLQSLRGCVLYSQAPDLKTWLTLVSWSVGVFVFGFIFFWLAEDKYVHVR